jgi:hypothetical protein
MARSTYFDLGRTADACPGSESGYAKRFQCGNMVKRRIWTRMIQRQKKQSITSFPCALLNSLGVSSGTEALSRFPRPDFLSSLIEEPLIVPLQHFHARFLV